MKIIFCFKQNLNVLKWPCSLVLVACCSKMCFVIYRSHLTPTTCTPSSLALSSRCLQSFREQPNVMLSSSSGLDASVATCSSSLNHIWETNAYCFVENKINPDSEIMDQRWRHNFFFMSSIQPECPTWTLYGDLYTRLHKAPKREKFLFFLANSLTSFILWLSLWLLERNISDSGGRRQFWNW